MTADQLFLVCNYGVLPAWVLLAVAPGAAITQRIVHAVWIPALLTAVYIWALFLNPSPPEGGSFSSLPGVTALFADPRVALGGWVHYLVFDLFVGAWEVRDSRRRGIPHLLVLPCLLFTLMFGPIGLCLYLALRYLRTKQLGFEELT
jgi:hypothetical protein